MPEREKPSWRERDRKKDASAHGSPRDEARPASTARVATATAQYKRQLDALFDRGVIPDALKDKLPAAIDPTEPDSAGKERVRLTRAVNKAAAGPELVRALDALQVCLGGLPDDLALVVRFLEHPSDAVLALALAKVEAALDLGLALPKAGRKTLLERLNGVSVSSFDPRVQARAAALVNRLR